MPRIPYTKNTFNPSSRTIASLTNYRSPYKSFKTFNRVAPFKSSNGFKKTGSFHVSGILETTGGSLKAAGDSVGEAERISL